MNRSSLHAGIWLIGLGILFLTDFFWPGILILIGLSMLVSALVPAGKSISATLPPPPGAGEPGVEPDSEAAIPPALGEGYTIIPEAPAHSTDRLPDDCPMCGGPVLNEPAQIVWAGYDSAHCPYCGTVLPLPDLKDVETEDIAGR